MENKDIAERIIERLKMFNRKERDHLIKNALCDMPKNLQLSTWLREALFGDEAPGQPEHLFVGMDYHLNWLFAALATSEVEELSKDCLFKNEWNVEAMPAENDKNEFPIQNNQEDVDLLIASWGPEISPRLRIFLIEAKLNSKWCSKQITSKKERLTLIREHSKNRDLNLNFIDWHFVLTSLGENGPSKGGFSHENFLGDFEWLRDPEKRGIEEGCVLRHIQMPVYRPLFQVKRLSDSDVGRTKWEVVLRSEGSKSSKS